MRLRVITEDGIEAELTTEHAASSYGLPVLVIDGIAYGTGDVSSNKLMPCADVSVNERDLAEQAGWVLINPESGA